MSPGLPLFIHSLSPPLDGEANQGRNHAGHPWPPHQAQSLAHINSFIVEWMDESMKNGGSSQWILCQLKSNPRESGETRREEIKSRVQKRKMWWPPQQISKITGTWDLEQDCPGSWIRTVVPKHFGLHSTLKTYWQPQRPFIYVGYIFPYSPLEIKMSFFFNFFKNNSSKHVNINILFLKNYIFKGTFIEKTGICFHFCKPINNIWLNRR